MFNNYSKKLPQVPQIRTKLMTCQQKRAILALFACKLVQKSTKITSFHKIFCVLGNLLKDISIKSKMARGRKVLKDIRILKDISLKDIRLPCSRMHRIITAKFRGCISNTVYSGSCPEPVRNRKFHQNTCYCRLTTRWRVKF